MPKAYRRQKFETSHVSYTDFRERLAAHMDQAFGTAARRFM